MDLRQTSDAIDAVIANVERVIRGKRDAVERATLALFAGQHLLLEDVPGVGKTMLARTIARSIDGSFKRIQGTSDLLPTDLTGSTVFDQSSRTFSFHPGPVFANVVLFDEINRAGPKTQSALLEVMDEGSVSVDGHAYDLPRPFFVAATRNPVEHHGTFPLPEGELDRFGVSVEIGYPDEVDERRVVAEQMVMHPLDELEPVISTEDVLAHQHAVRTVYVEPSVLEYIVAVVRATRERADVALGASPRGSVSLTRVAQAHAVLRGRDHVLPDDVKGTAVSVLAHRILPAADIAGGADVTRPLVAEVLAIAALLLGVLVAGLVAPRRGLLGIAVSRRVPRTAVAGQQVPVTLDVSNQGRRLRALVGVYDEFCGSGAAIVGILRPGQMREYKGRRSAARRGVHVGGVCVLVTGAPFGVLRARRRLDIRSPIVIYPRTYDVPPRVMLGGAGRPTHAPVGDVSSVREYRPGDPLRHIHWRSSARRDQLVVREFDDEERAEVAVIAVMPDTPDAADDVASLACSLALGYLHGGSRVRLLAGNDGRPAAVTAHFDDDVLDWGARLSDRDCPPSALFAAAAGAPGIVCVCPVEHVDALGPLSARGATSVLVVLVSPDRRSGDQPADRHSAQPGDQEVAERAARLRTQGASVAVVQAGEIETWFAAGCSAS